MKLKRAREGDERNDEEGGVRVLAFNHDEFVF